MRLFIQSQNLIILYCEHDDLDSLQMSIGTISEVPTFFNLTFLADNIGDQLTYTTTIKPE